MRKLTDAKCRALKEGGKYFDGGGLYLHVFPSGTKSWKIDYRFEGKYRTYTAGKYPVVTLSEARETLLHIKRQLAQGICPSSEKRAARQAAEDAKAHTFEAVASKWLETKHTHKTPKHRQDITSKLERFIFPRFRSRDIKTITAQEMLECVRRIEDKGLFETTKKTLGICKQIFSFAVGEGILEANVCAELGKQLKSAPVKHFAAITERKEFAQLLRDIDAYPHGVLIRIALQLEAHVFLRPGELVNAPWSEIDFESALWTIPPERMKLRRKHLVPLSRQALELLHDLHKVTGDTPHLFHNWNTRKPITIDGLRQGLRRLGYDANTMTTHGFRHSASTMLNELGYNRDWIEAQLAHSTEGSVRGTYNHAEYLPERRKMLQEWSDFLDDLKSNFHFSIAPDKADKKG